MTEIRGTDFAVSRQLMMRVLDAAKDGDVSKEEITQLTDLAKADSAGLTDDEKKLIASIDANSGDPDLVKSNIAALRTLAEHTTDANSVSFGGLNLQVKESKWFGLSSDLVSHGVQVNDSNIPIVNNPPTTTSMTDRNKLEQANLVKMIGPLENELAATPPSAELHDRIAKMIQSDPTQPPATEDQINAKITELKDKIAAYKANPSENFSPMYDSVCELATAYAKNPPSESSALGKGYFASLNGAMYNVLDTNRLAHEEQSNLSAGNYQTPGTVAEINQGQSTLSTTAQQSVTKMLEDTSTLTDAMVKLQKDNPAKFEEVMHGFGVADLDALRAKVETLKQETASGKPITQAQMSEINNIWGSLTRVRAQSDLGNIYQTMQSSTPEKVAAQRTELQQGLTGNQGLLKDAESRLAAAQIKLNDPTLDDTAKNQIQTEILQTTAEVEGYKQEITSINSKLTDLDHLPPPPSADIKALALAYNQAFGENGSVQSASSAVEAFAKKQSTTVAELDQVQQTIADVLKRPDITPASKEALLKQLTAIKTAKDQLNQGQPINFTDPAQSETFDKVLGMISAMKKPAETATTEPPPITQEVSGIGSADPILNFEGSNTTFLNPVSTTQPFTFNTTLGGVTRPPSYLSLGTLYSTPSYSPITPSYSMGLNTSLTLNTPLSLNLSPYSSNSLFSDFGSVYGPPAPITAPKPATAPAEGPKPKSMESLVLEGIQGTQKQTGPTSTDPTPSPTETDTPQSFDIPETVKPENVEAYKSLMLLENMNSAAPSTRDMAHYAMQQLAATPPDPNGVAAAKQFAAGYSKLEDSQGREAALLAMDNISGSLLEKNNGDLKKMFASPNLAADIDSSVQQMQSQGAKLAAQIADMDNRYYGGIASTQNKIDTANVGSVTNPLKGIEEEILADPVASKNWDKSKPLSVNLCTMDPASYEKYVLNRGSDLNTEINTKTARLKELQSTKQTLTPAQAAEKSKLEAELIPLQLKKGQLSAAIDYRAAFEAQDQGFNSAISTLEAQKSAMVARGVNPAIITGLDAQIDILKTARTTLHTNGQITPEMGDQLAIADGLNKANDMMLRYFQTNQDNPAFRAQGEGAPPGLFNNYQAMLSTKPLSMAKLDKLMMDVVTDRRLKPPTPRIDTMAASGVPTPSGQTGLSGTMGLLSVPMKTVASQGGGTEILPGTAALDTRHRWQNLIGEQNLTAETINSGPVKAYLLHQLQEPNGLINLIASKGHLPEPLQQIVAGVQPNFTEQQLKEYLDTALAKYGTPGQSPVTSNSSAGSSGVPNTTGGVTGTGGTGAAGAPVTTGPGATPVHNTSVLSDEEFLNHDISGDPASPVAKVAAAYANQAQVLSTMTGPELQTTLHDAFEASTAILKANNDITSILEPLANTLHQSNQQRQQDFAASLNQFFISAALKDGMDPKDLAGLAETDPELDAKSIELIKEADAMEDNNELAPMPAISGEALFGKWLTETLGIIRNWDETERQNALAQIAIKMLEQVNSAFHKRKTDESNEYHEKQLEKLSGHQTQMINQDQGAHAISTASSGQSVAAISGGSGEVKSGDRSAAFSRASLRTTSVDQARDQLKDMIRDARKATPPLKITMLQEQTILSKFEKMIKAGATPGIEDDRSTVMSERSSMLGADLLGMKRF